MISLKRLEKFLFSKEYNKSPIIKNNDNDSKYAIFINGVDFGIIKDEEIEEIKEKKEEEKVKTNSQDDSEDTELDDFNDDSLGIQYYAPRIEAKSFCDLTARPGWLRMRGQEARSSLNRVSILARKLQSVNAEVVTRMDFKPEIHQHSAGLILYYDNMNFFYLGKTFSEELGQPMLQLLRLENGKKYEYPDHIVPLREQGPVWLRFTVEGRDTRFYYSFDGETYFPVGPSLDTSLLSDEYSDYGEFTGTFAGITCADRLLHEKSADFDFFELKNT
jgi:xylan 1,4-beta-xylosidase